MKPTGLLILLTFIAAGCGAGGPDPRKGRELPRSKPPPAYPASKDVALDPQLRFAAEMELGKSLHHVDPNVRAHAIEAVKESVGPAHAKEIIAALSDPDPLVRYAAGLAVGELKLSDAKEPLAR